MRVEWLPAALADRDAIIAYLEARNISGKAPGTRELVAVPPYLLVYEVDAAGEMVRILRV